jgi:hypothetical protein
LCGLKTEEIHTNGIDRFDSDKGYIEENVYSCCSSCNFLKNDTNISVLLNKLILIFENYKSNGELIKIINKIKKNNNNLLDTYNINNIKVHLNKKKKEELNETQKINTLIARETKIERFKTENILNRENKRKLLIEESKLNNALEHEKNEKQIMLNQFTDNEPIENIEKNELKMDEVEEDLKIYDLIDNQNILNDDINNLILKIIDKYNKN